MLWLRNPFPKLIVNGSIDLQISTDKFNGDQWSEQNLINTGFYMVRSNNKTIALFDSWYAQKNNSGGQKEQDVLLNLMHQGLFHNLGLKVMFLDTVFFSGFCEDSKDARVVSTVHANCCRSIVAKVADLSTVMADWRRFKSLSANESSSFFWSPHDRCIDSWRQWTIIYSSFSFCCCFFLSSKSFIHKLEVQWFCHLCLCKCICYVSACITNLF